MIQRRYDPRQSYAVGEAISHPAFGTGRAVEVVGADRVIVDFERHGRKFLVMKKPNHEERKAAERERLVAERAARRERLDALAKDEGDDEPEEAASVDVPIESAPRCPPPAESEQKERHGSRRRNRQIALAASGPLRPFQIGQNGGPCRLASCEKPGKGPRWGLFCEEHGKERGYPTHSARGGWKKNKAPPAEASPPEPASADPPAPATAPPTAEASRPIAPAPPDLAEAAARGLEGIARLAGALARAIREGRGR